MLLILSVSTLRHAMGLAGGASDHHLVILASIEASSALLFLFPLTMAVGGIGLLVTFAVAIAIHLSRGEFPGPLLIYAAGTLLVMVHGSAWRKPAGTKETPAQ